MNPLTNVKNIQKLSEQELKRNFKTSWHDQYRDSAWVFVGGLPYDLTEGDIICVFSQYGEVVNLNLVRDKSTGKSKGFCFLCYEDQRSTILAVDNFNGMKILGRIIRVDHVSDYKPPKESKNVDEVTKMLYEAGCAPGAKVLSATDENRKQETTDSKEGILKKVKKEKKKKTKKLKKSAKRKSSKKKKKRKKEESSSSSSTSSESSTESSESPSSKEESEEEPDQGRNTSKGKEKKMGSAVHGESKERNASPGQSVKVKVEEEEEEKRRARREEHSTKEQWALPSSREHGIRIDRTQGGGNPRIGAKYDEGYPSRSADGDPSGRGTREVERWRGDADIRRRVGDRGRDEERRKRDGCGSSKDEGRYGNSGIGRREWHEERDYSNRRRDGEAAGDDGRGRKDEYGRKHDDKNSQRKGEKCERFEDNSYDRRKKEERKRQDGRSRSPCERDGGKTKRSH